MHDPFTSWWVTLVHPCAGAVGIDGRAVVGHAGSSVVVASVDDCYAHVGAEEAGFAEG